MVRKAVRQASKAASFKDASDDLRELAGLSISPTHLQRLCERVGTEWAQARDLFDLDSISKPQHPS